MKSRSKELSKRERDVVELLLQGKSNKQIAIALDIGETTVEFHLRNIYAKLQVSSRAEAILRLGKSMSLMTEYPRETIVENERKIDHTGGTLISEERESVSRGRKISNTGKDLEMKNRLFTYFVTGLVFGALFLFYFEVIDRFMNTIHINEKNPLSVWLFVSAEFLLIFGVWLVPTLYPAKSEFRHSSKIIPSVIAVMVMWGSAVLGYYLTYTALLAFVGFPNDWANLFPQLILFKFLRRTILGVIIGGMAGLITTTLYSFWVRKTHRTMSAS